MKYKKKSQSLIVKAINFFSTLLLAENLRCRLNSLEGLKTLVEVIESKENLQVKKLDLFVSSGIIHLILGLTKNSEIEIVEKVVNLITKAIVTKNSKIRDLLLESDFFKHTKSIIK